MTNSMKKIKVDLLPSAACGRDLTLYDRGVRSTCTSIRVNPIVSLIDPSRSDCTRLLRKFYINQTAGKPGSSNCQALLDSEKITRSNLQRFVWASEIKVPFYLRWSDRPYFLINLSVNSRLFDCLHTGQLNPEWFISWVSLPLLCW